MIVSLSSTFWIDLFNPEWLPIYTIIAESTTNTNRILSNETSTNAKAMFLKLSENEKLLITADILKSKCILLVYPQEG